MEFETRHLRAQIEKLKADFQNEVKELKFQIYSDEVKKYSESIGHMDARLKTFEHRKFTADQEKQSDSDNCKLIR